MSSRPAPKAASKSFKGKFKALQAENPEFLQNLPNTSERSKYYDKSAPSTVGRRERARANFVHFLQESYNISDEDVAFDRDTIIDYTCQFIETMAQVARGKLGDKVKVGTLYQLREALEWWIKVNTQNFKSIERQWHTQVSRHIHRIAIEQGLNTLNREKNNLGVFDLDRFYRVVMSEGEHVANWKQHYTIWVLAYISAARPGSYAVSSDYRKGGPLGGAVSDELPGRAESHTLRWKDVEFRRVASGISCTVTFRFSKGHQDPHKEKYVMSRREFLFLPKKQRLHLDLSVLLFCMAYERGLFKKTLPELLNGSEKNIAKGDEFAEEAVFLAAMQHTGKHSTYTLDYPPY
jgi:hypothetical protein